MVFINDVFGCTGPTPKPDKTTEKPPKSGGGELSPPVFLQRSLHSEAVQHVATVVT